MIYLYGPRMKDSALGFGLTYPHVICDDPTRYLSRYLFRAPDQINIAKVTKLPRAPIPMTPRNLTFIASALLAALMIFLMGLTHADNLSQKHRLATLERKSAQYKKLNSHYRALEKQELEQEAEKDFYLSITKRRTPWDQIFKDISKLTPKELWFERINASKMKLLIMGKARSAEDVSDLSINLNNNSKYVQDALIIGTRDYEEENGSKYSEFQIQAKFKSPTGKFTEKVE
jgi:Tfp pilus assembly protein PilN